MSAIKSQPLICVGNVEKSSQWYWFLGLRK